MSVATLLLKLCLCLRSALAFRFVARDSLACSAHRRAASPLHVLERNRGDVRPISSPLRNAPPPIAPPNSTRVRSWHDAQGDGWGAVEEQGFARYFDMRRFRERLLASDEETRRAILFTRIRSEAAALANSPLLRAPMLAIEERRSLGEALIEVVARHLSHPEFLPREHLVGLLAPLMTDEVVEMAAQDLLEITSKDPAVSSSLLQPFFFYKGFHAVAAQRLAHQLWLTGSILFSVDIGSSSERGMSYRSGGG